jgi:hypothetical protein
MSSNKLLSIIDRRLKLGGDRKRIDKESLKAYDQKVYNPAMTKLREDCAAEGHEGISGTTGMFRICGKCGLSFIGNGR